MNNAVREDQLARDRIRSELDTNFFVEAGAGAGKTSVLVDRMTNLVKAGRSVGRICAITFTKTAAGEFYFRFRNRLREEAAKGSAECAAALRDIDLCFMGTIDSFCNMILSEHPARAGIPSSARVITDDEFKNAALRCYADIQRGAYGPELQGLCLRFRSINRYPDALFVSMMSEMSKRRQARFLYTSPSQESTDTVFSEEKASLVRLVRYLTGHQEAAYSGEAGSTKSWDALITRGMLLGTSWDSRTCDIIRLVKDIKGLRLLPGFDLDLLAQDGYWFQLHESRGKPGWYEFDDTRINALVSGLKDRVFGISLEFAEKCLGILTSEMKKKGTLTFFDYLLYTRDMLKNDAASGGALIRHIHARHSTFLIDEFQDTDPLQAEVFFYLASEDPVPDWKECVPSPGSLFIVGDPKQSIYRFRNADVGSYNKVKGLFKGNVGCTLLLTANNRSTEEMCGWFNGMFTKLLPGESKKDQSCFVPIPPTDKPPAEGNFSGVYSYTVSRNSRPDPDAVLSILRRLVHNPSFLIRERDDTAQREITWKDIMLITNSKTHLAEYAELFTLNSVPYYLEGKLKFSDCPAMCALVSVYCAAARPSRRNLYSALTSPFGGVSGKKLLLFTQSGGRLDIYSEQPEECDSGIRGLISSIRNYAVTAQTVSPSVLFQIILEDTAVFARTGTKNLEYVWYALELLRSGETDGTVATAQEAADFLQELIDNDKTCERCLGLSRASDRIHIANLHKVKGLEAPIVILAAPGHKDVTPSVRMDYSAEPPACRFFKFTSEYSELLSCGDPGAAGDEEKQSAAAEALRLLYVAATRARRALIVGFVVKIDGTPSSDSAWAEFFNPDTPDFFAEFGGIPDGVETDSGTVDADELYREGSDTISGRDASRAASYSIMRPSTVKLKRLLSQEDDYEDTAESEVRSDEKRSAAAFTGTLVHRLMELLVLTGNRPSSEELADEILNEYGAPEEPYRSLVTGVCEKIRSGGYTQENGAPENILNELLSADEVHCELPFCRRSGDGTVLWNGVMDAVYLKNGVWHIVDYKTNADAEHLEEKYEGQLAAYREAFLAMTGSEAKTVIYHIDL